MTKTAATWKIVKRKTAAFLAAAVMMSGCTPELTVCAMDGTMSAEARTDQAAAEATVSDASSLLSSIPLAPEVMKVLLAGMDTEVLDLLIRNPKLIPLVIPTLHVMVTDSAVTVSVKEKRKYKAEKADEESGEKAQEGQGTGNGNAESRGIVRTNGGRLNVREGAGTGYRVITQLQNGAEVSVTGEENGWTKVQLPADLGYVCSRYLEIRKITPEKTEEGYSFDIDGGMILGFLKMLEGYFSPEAEPAENEASQPVPSAGLTPDGNLTLVDDYGKRTGEGQQFITLISKNGNYFYMVIDRDDKGEENVHFLNLVDERDLLQLMEKDDKTTYAAMTEAEKKALEAKAQAEKEAADRAAAEAKEREKGEKGKGSGENLAPLVIVPVILAAIAGAWFYLQTKKKKKVQDQPDPDAGYSEEEEEDYASGEDGAEDDAGDSTDDEGYDPYEEDDAPDSGEDTSMPEDNEQEAF